jgi:DNA polymerase-3 subunit delta
MKEIEEKFIREVDSSQINFTRLTEKNSKEELPKILLSPPFLARRRLVVVPDFLVLSKEVQEELVNFLEKGLPEELILVIRLPSNLDVLPKEWINKLKSTKYLEEFKLLYGKMLERAVEEMAKKFSLQLSPQAKQMLIRLTNGNLWQIRNEIAKLRTFVQNQKVTEKEVREVVSKNFDENIFHLIDAWIEGNFKQTLLLLEEQLEAGLGPGVILYRLENYLRQLITIRLLLEDGKTMKEISLELGLQFFLSQKMTRQIKRWNITKLKEAYRWLLKIETQIKSGQGDLLTLFSIFILSHQGY